MLIIHRFLFFCATLHLAYGFDAGWTSGFLPSDDTTHYTMTQCALLDSSGQYLSSVFGLSSIPSMIKVTDGQCEAKNIITQIRAQLLSLKIDHRSWSSAMEHIIESNRRRDILEALNEGTHFDGESFDEGASLISNRYDTAVASVRRNEYENARKTFGSMLHTVQDFYSHSNWIEMNFRVPNNGIGKHQILGKYASRDRRACVDCEGDSCKNNIEPSIKRDNILTSGYFQLIPSMSEGKKPLGKCSHGGFGDFSIYTDAKGGGISKDTQKSDHGNLHKAAASVAYESTKQILRRFQSQVGEESFGKFLGLPYNTTNSSSTSLAIVMDTTGSMGPYINMAKQIAISIVNIHKTLKYNNTNYILSPFNDPTWGPLTITRDPEEFQRAINNLYPYGGGDEPELYYHGIVDALQVCEQNSAIYAFTDAPAKDAYLKSEAIQLALEKSVTITLFYASSFSSSKQTGASKSLQIDEIENLNSNENSLSSITGGIVMNIDSNSLNLTTNYILNRLNASDIRPILLLNSFNNNMTFFIDSSIKSIQIELFSKSYLDSTLFRLINPSGQYLFPTPISSSTTALVYSIPINSTDRGLWTIMSRMNVPHTIQLSGYTNILCSTSLQERTSIAMSNTSFVTLEASPTIEDPNLYVQTSCENLPSDIQDALVYVYDLDSPSMIVQTLSASNLFSNGLLSSLKVPNKPFRINTILTLKDGTIVQSQKTEVITPSSISLTVDNQPYFILRNDSLSIKYTIRNHGSTPLSASLRVIDTLNVLPAGTIQENKNIPAMESIHGEIKAPIYILNQTIYSNETTVIDTFIFSVTYNGQVYVQNVPVYIQDKFIPLTNQSEYQEPPPEGSGSSKQVYAIVFIDFVIILLSLLVI